MTTQHTPGPWAYKIFDDADLHVSAGKADVIWGCGCCGSPRCKEADARLIAAAPDLLDALKTVLDEFIGSDLSGYDSGSPVEKARAAIKKATGETE